MRICCRQLLFDHHLNEVNDQSSDMLTIKNSFLSIPFGPDEKSTDFYRSNDKIKMIFIVPFSRSSRVLLRTSEHFFMSSDENQRFCREGSNNRIKMIFIVL